MSVETVTNAVLKEVQRWYPDSILDRDNRVMVSSHHGAAYVDIGEHSPGEGDVFYIAQVWAHIAFDVERTPELFEWLAVSGSDFLLGHVVLEEGEDGYAVALFRNRLDITNSLDALGSSVAAVIESAHELGSEFEDRGFGLL